MTTHRSLFTALPFALLTLCTLSAPALQIVNRAPAPGRASAWMQGTLSETNGTTNAVSARLCWGPINGSTNVASWWYTNTVISMTSTGIVSTNVTGLTPGGLYYCRWLAAEGTNTAWAPSSTSFWCLAGVPTSAPPVVTYFPVSADTNGNIVSPTNLSLLMSTGNWAAAWSWIQDNSNRVAHAVTNATGQLGDFMADGSVPMAGNLNMGEIYSVTNVSHLQVATIGSIFGNYNAVSVWERKLRATNGTEMLDWSDASAGVRFQTVPNVLGNLLLTNAPSSSPTNWASYTALYQPNLGGLGLTNVGTYIWMDGCTLYSGASELVIRMPNGVDPAGLSASSVRSGGNLCLTNEPVAAVLLTNSVSPGVLSGYGYSTGTVSQAALAAGTNGAVGMAKGYADGLSSNYATAAQGTNNFTIGTNALAIAQAAITQAQLTSATNSAVGRANAFALGQGFLTNAPGSSVVAIWAGPATNQSTTNSTTLYFTW